MAATARALGARYWLLGKQGQDERRYGSEAGHSAEGCERIPGMAGSSKKHGRLSTSQRMAANVAKQSRRTLGAKESQFAGHGPAE